MRVAVIGAGIAGLVAARRLTLAGHSCEVYERWPGLGGQAATVDVGGGHLLERYYHHLFTSDRDIVELYEELGMPDELEWLNSSTAMWTGGRLWPFTTPLDLLRFGPMPPAARVRMGAAAVLLQRFGGTYERYEDVTARDWVLRWMGRHAWDAVWGPMMEGKFGPRAGDISMVWLHGKLTQRRQISGEEARGERLGYPRGSWQRLLERLADDIRSSGGRVHIDRPVTVVRRGRDGQGFDVQPAAPGAFRTGHDPRRMPVADTPAEHFDAVLATVPSDIFGQLLDPELSAEVGAPYLAQLDDVEYHTALCLLLEIDRQFSPYYWTNVADRSVPFIGVIEHTNLVPAARYDGRRFLYVPNYLTADSPLLQLDADELLELYMPSLSRMAPGFSRDRVRARWVFREPAAQPIVTPGFGRRIPPLRTPADGLILANTTQIYPEDRGTSYSVRLGEQAALTLLTAGR